jgi:tetratricopeptide (TPR) repeat protein
LLGSTLIKSNDLSAAKLAFETSLILSPNFIEPKFNLANLEMLEQNFAGAIVLYEEILNSADFKDINETPIEPIKFSLSLAYLATGKINLGWEYYDFGFHPNNPVNSRRSPNRSFSVPCWKGERIEEKKILVWGEQGIGDELLFLTCINDLESTNAQIIIECQERLVSIISRSFSKCIVRPSAFFNQIDQASVFNDFDIHIPMGSLPKYFRKSIKDFKNGGPYIKVDSSLVKKFEFLLQNSCKSKHRIGICWRSGKLDSERNKHYTSLSDWGEILSNKNCDFINLQYDDCEIELLQAEEKFSIQIIRWEDLDLKNDFDSTMALISRLDYVITVGTAVHSMAASVGIQVILMQPYGWTNFGTNNYPFFDNVHCLFPPKGGYTAHCIADAAKIIGSLN